MKKLYQFLLPFAATAYIRVALISVLIIILLIFPYLLGKAGGGTLLDIPDTHFYYSPAQQSEIIKNMDTLGRTWYPYISLTADILFPISIFFAFSLSMINMDQKIKSQKKGMPGILGFPLAGMIFDILENFFTVLSVKSFPNIPLNLAIACSVFTLLKWAGISASAVMTLALVMTRRKQK
ncbi:MAG: hypothetical protein JXA19_05720 [Anaerolineales bacterium]|nr:hypothetical protein [Anaerolineales bacterium]